MKNQPWFALCYHFMPWLTHWGRVTHIYVSDLTNIGSDNGLSPARRQAIIWTNAGILLIEPLGTNFSEILIGIQIFSFKKMRLKMSSAKWRPFCLGLNVLRCLHEDQWQQRFNSFSPGKKIKWPPFRRHFQAHFLEWNCQNFYSNSTKLCSQGFDRQ